MHSAFTDAKRLAILDAALAEFGELDFSGASIRGIAERAGVAKGTIYLYFKDKEELFEAATARGWELFFAEAESIVARAGGPVERLLALVDAGFARLKEAYPLVRGMLSGASRGEFLDEAVRRLCGLVDGGIRGAPAADRAGSEASHGVVRLMVAGVLFEIATSPRPRLEETLARLRSTIGAYLAEELA